MSGDYSLAELCAVACAEAWRGDGEILASGIGALPALAARLARATFAPDLVISDGVAAAVAADGSVEAPLPYRRIFDIVWAGRRHVMMGAAQIDRFGNQNIAAIGDPRRPKAQLLGPRGAPGNTVNHATSYFVPRHSPSVFVERVDFVCGIGYDRAARLGARFHELRRVVTDLGVFDFETPDRAMRVRSLHPGVTLEEVQRRTGFTLAAPPEVPATRAPTDEEMRLIREVLDPDGSARQELAPR
jgi:acyl CoA:acetate/3-ketoacid CoA transferase beta subunit